MDEQAKKVDITTLTQSAATKEIYEVGRREQVLVVLALMLGILGADLLLSVGYQWPGLGVTVGVAVWYAVLLWYLGVERLKVTHSRLFLTAILLLAMTFTLFSNGWFRFFNLGALVVLLTIHTFELSGVTCKPWYLPTMLWERFRLLLAGLFGRLGALAGVGKTLRSPTARRGLMVCAGLAVTVPLVLAAAGLLSQADPVFRLMAADALDLIYRNLDVTTAKLLLGLLAAPFLFSLLYTLGHPKPLEGKKQVKILVLDSVVPVMVLGALDHLYLLFLGVQSAALFGGEAYLQTMGISYAEYARSGFFQLVFVTMLNLTVVMTILSLTARTGRGWRLIRILSTALAALSGVILVSAAWRMTLYVTTYGLSFKRVLTYWGMGMMALFLSAACLKIWNERFSFFRVSSVAALVGWLILNYASVDVLVARYNVDLYLESGGTAAIDLEYLTGLSYEALPVLERLNGSLVIDGTWYYGTLEARIQERSQQASAECAAWENWSVPAYMAAQRAGSTSE